MKVAFSYVAIVFIIVLAFLTCQSLEARGGGGGFGGGRSSGGFSSSGRASSFGGSRSFSAPRPSVPSTPSRSAGGSYFGGSRSGGSNVTITKPVPKAPASSSASSSPSHTTVINNGGGGYYGGGGGNGFFTGFLFGNLLSRPTPVVVAPAPVMGSDGVMTTPAPVVAEGPGFFFYFFRFVVWAVILTLMVFGVVYLVQRWRETY